MHGGAYELIAPASVRELDASRSTTSSTDGGVMLLLSQCFNRAMRIHSPRCGCSAQSS